MVVRVLTKKRASVPKSTLSNTTENCSSRHGEAQNHWEKSFTFTLDKDTAVPTVKHSGGAIMLRVHFKFSASCEFQKVDGIMKEDMEEEYLQIVKLHLKLTLRPLKPGNKWVFKQELVLHKADLHQI